MKIYYLKLDVDTFALMSSDNEKWGSGVYKIDELKISCGLYRIFNYGQKISIDTLQADLIRFWVDGEIYFIDPVEECCEIVKIEKCKQEFLKETDY